MLDVGSKATNPRTGTLWEVRELNDADFVLRYSIPAGVSKPEVAPHYHVGWQEEFRVHEGRGEYRLDGVTHQIAAGDSVTLPEKVKHVHPYSTGPDPMVIDQVGTLTNPAPNAIRDTLGFFFTMFEWEADGKIRLDKIGLPRNPMQFALAGRVLGRAGGYDARVPKSLADFGGATFGWLSEKLGYEVIDKKWR